MVLFNYATKELTAKVVYYGPGLCGKTRDEDELRRRALQLLVELAGDVESVQIRHLTVQEHHIEGIVFCDRAGDHPEDFSGHACHRRSHLPRGQEPVQDFSIDRMIVYDENAASREGSGHPRRLDRVDARLDPNGEPERAAATRLAVQTDLATHERLLCTAGSGSLT